MNEAIGKDTARIGSLTIGPGYPVAVQTMWEKPLNEDDAALRGRLELLSSLGCAMIRFAIPNMGALAAIKRVKRMTDMPVIADIHFDYQLALACMDVVDKIRINPGNIGAPWKVAEVLSRAAGNGVCIRIGINAGSLPADLRRRPDTAAAMTEAAERELELIEAAGDKPEIVFSLKSSDIETTVKANSAFREKYRYPLHIGLTEAGPIIPGLVKSTLALSRLLERNVGETLRISLSDAPENEVIAGRQLLKALGKSSDTVTVVSCPQCGRAEFPVHAFLRDLGYRLYAIRKNITVAVMGCVVNGPEEAKHADIGITGSGNSVVIFRKGTILRKVSVEEAVPLFLSEVEKL